MTKQTDLRKPLYILKLGGSIITDKNNTDKSGDKFDLQKNRIAQIVAILADELRADKAQLILVHGAGSAGHVLAKRHDLVTGAGTDSVKRAASIASVTQVAQITTNIAQNFVNCDTIALPIHTSSVIVNSDRQIAQFDTATIRTALNNNIVPILYGSMVLDTDCGFSICSGDTIIAHLAQTLDIAQIFFASDVAGIYTSDPHTNPDAEHFAQIRLADIDTLITNGTLSQSHNTDVTDGLRGKLAPFTQFAQNQTLQSITIFDGTNPTNFHGILTDNLQTKATQIMVN